MIIGQYHGNHNLESTDILNNLQLQRSSAIQQETCAGNGYNLCHTVQNTDAK